MSVETTAVYCVQSDLDDPRSEGFAQVDRREPSLLGIRGWHSDDRARDFYPPKPAGPDWVPPELRDVWRPLRVKGRVRAWNDFPTVAMVIPAFSRRAVDALSDILRPRGELLPLACDYGAWWAYNLRLVADVVDVGRSTRSPTDTGGDVFQFFTRYELYPERLPGLTLFRIRQDPSGMYATQDFVDRVRAAGLLNFQFDRIWPWPEGTVWYGEVAKQRRAERAARRATAAAPPPDLRRHSVVVRLQTGEPRLPSKPQREHVGAIMDGLDALLADPHAAHDAPVYGNLQGDEPVKGEHRLFLSCPDADRLVDRLRPWLHSLSWPGRVVVVKRYGEVHETAAREEAVAGPWLT